MSLSNAQAQTLFTSADKSVERTFKKETKDFLKTLKENTKSVSIISIGQIKEYLIDGHIRFAVDQKDTVSAKVHHWEYYDNGNWRFFGEFVGGYIGDVQINLDSSGIYGFFNYGQRMFEILSTDLSEVSILVEHFPTKHKCGTIGKDKPKINDLSLSPRSTQACDLSKIRVLVVYTAAALNAVNNNVSTINNRVNNGINIFNNANAISGVNQPQAELELAGIISTNYVEPYLSSPPPQDQNTWNNNYFNPLINALKTTKIQFEADVLVLLTNYTNWQGTIGVAASEPAQNDDAAYTMVQIAASNASSVFAHEIGHLLNGTHGTAHQYDYQLCGACPIEKRYTIMTSGSNPLGNPALRWSNPNINDGINPTGTSTKNNAQRIASHAPILAGLRESPNSANAVISGPTAIYSMGTYTYTIAAGCPTPSYITWHKSTNGTSWTLAGQATTGISQFFYPGYTNTFYVRCTLHFPNGSSLIRFWATFVYESI